MAAPQITEVVQKVGDKILLYFDQPLDDDIAFPETCFSINYGKIPITSAGYYGTAGIILVIDRTLTWRDKAEVNYQPPADIALALRAPVGTGASNAVIKRNAVRAFYKVPIKNMIPPDENAWMANSNLGGSKVWTPEDSPEFDGTLPGFDICGDGSVIIGNPNNIINGNPNGNPANVQGSITGLTNLVGGSGYASGIYNNVPLTGGLGTGARATINVGATNAVDSIVLSHPGADYQVGDVLSILDSDVGGAGGINFTITVAAIYETTGTAGTAAADSGTPGSNSSGWGSNWETISYPKMDRPRPRSATPDDFILAFGLREATQISNIDDADAAQPNTERIWMAIEDACALIDNYIQGATRGGKILISSNRRRVSLIMARYYLDTVRRREDVKADYEAAIQELDRARSLEDLIRPDLPWWADPCNPNRAKGVRAHRIPQYYNGVSGKGLDGWWVDSAYEEGADFRTNHENSQNNNDLQNGGARSTGSTAPREPQQPVDDGGLEGGGANP